MRVSNRVRRAVELWLDRLAAVNCKQLILGAHKCIRSNRALGREVVIMGTIKGVRQMRMFIVSLSLLVIVGTLLSGCDNLEQTTPSSQAQADTSEVASEKPAGDEAVMCPVMTDMSIDKNIYVDHEGQRIYFCCQKCIAEFKEDPEKFLKVSDGKSEAQPSADDKSDHSGHEH